MITLDFDYKVLARQITKKVRSKNKTILGRVGGTVRRIARNSIRVASSGKNLHKPSKAGRPPKTRGKRKLKNSIIYEVDRTTGTVFIGPAFSWVKDVGKAHEFGGLYKGRRYPKRPFMEPAMKKTLPKVPDYYKNIL